jgi:hypothetical protein
MGISYMPLFVAGEILLSIFITWIFNNTKCSLLLGGFLAHNADNFWGTVLLTNATMTSALSGAETSVNTNLYVLSTIMYAFFVVLLIWRTKGKLGQEKRSNA